MNIRYTPKAVEDLRTIRQYVIDEFDKTTAAQTMGRIVGDISTLKDFPDLMRPLSGKIHRPSRYLYFLCGKSSIAIFKRTNSFISVIRIFDCRCDYVNILL